MGTLEIRKIDSQITSRPDLANINNQLLALETAIHFKSSWLIYPIVCFSKQDVLRPWPFSRLFKPLLGKRVCYKDFFLLLSFDDIFLWIYTVETVRLLIVKRFWWFFIWRRFWGSWRKQWKRSWLQSSHNRLGCYFAFSSNLWEEFLRWTHRYFQHAPVFHFPPFSSNVSSWRFLAHFKKHIFSP